jgi:methionyl aminopeptidase
VVHGIPGERKLKQGDIVGLDLGCIVDGFYGDAARTVAVGEVGGDVLRLLKVTEEALRLGIAQCQPGRRLGDLGHAVEKHALDHGFSVVRDFCGHGIGTSLHEEPQVPNYGPPGRRERLVPGMCLAIEPMVNMGGPDVKVLKDGWTAVTADGSLSAHFELSIAITEHGPWVLAEPYPYGQLRHA